MHRLGTGYVHNQLNIDLLIFTGEPEDCVHEFFFYKYLQPLHEIST